VDTPIDTQIYNGQRIIETLMRSTPEKSVLICLFALALAIICIGGCLEEQAPVDVSGNNIFGNISNTDSTSSGKITIDSIGTFDYDPREIETVRKDIFQPGHFSIFDILVYLDRRGDIEMAYHFDENMNTHVIDSIYGKMDWWYMAYYDGGWPEPNAFRMDLYPHKDDMYIRIIQDDASMIEGKYRAFFEETKRKEQNGGKVIIPEVIIDGPTTNERFENSEVIAHDLRTDVFLPGTVTAMDVIMSLGDEGKLTYDLQWHDSIGSTGVVRTYFVDRINQDKSLFRCGFVYEAGSSQFRGSRGNHVHIPADTRVINSPEYEEWFWICI